MITSYSLLRESYLKRVPSVLTLGYLQNAKCAVASCGVISLGPNSIMVDKETLHMEKRDTMIVQFKQRGGARLGFFNLTWPFVTLTADSRSIRLGGVVRFEIPKTSLVALVRHRGFFSTGLRIEHDAPKAPAFIVFWTFNYDDLADNLRAFGYTVDDPQR
jgi:hypothetical protein